MFFFSILRHVGRLCSIIVRQVATLRKRGQTQQPADSMNCYLRVAFVAPECVPLLLVLLLVLCIVVTDPRNSAGACATQPPPANASGSINVLYAATFLSRRGCYS